MIWLIGIGGSIGAASRFLLGTIINKWERGRYSFPISTFFINITGSFLLGILANLYVTNHLADWFWYLVGIGFCGAYTTFSTFGYETITLIKNKQEKQAIMYVLLSLIGGVCFASIGVVLRV